MSEVNATEPVVEAMHSPGAILREARQKHGLSEEDVATELNLSISHIQALEDDRFQELPGETYIRGYLKAYARLVGTEADEVLKNFNRQENPAITGIRPAIKHTRGSDKRMKLLSVLVILILGGLMFMWWQGREPSSFIPLKVMETFSPDEADSSPDDQHSAQTEQQGSDMRSYQSTDSASPAISNGDNISAEATTAAEDAQTVPATNTPAGAEIATPPAAGIPIIQPVIETLTGLNAEPSTQESIAGEQPSQVRAEVPTQNAATQAQSTATTGTRVAGTPSRQPAAGASRGVEEIAAGGENETGTVAPEVAPIPSVKKKKKSNAGSGTSSADAEREVKLQVSATSWIDLRDASGQRLLYENVVEGSTVAVRGKPPFSVFLGNAQAVQIEYGGDEFDFSAFTNGIYARFELGAE